MQTRASSSLLAPNGAGKTTFAREFLPREAGLPVFINADLIAAGLSPFKPEDAAIQAGRLMLAEMAEKTAKRESFAFETTLSGQGYARHIAAWRKAGYWVELFFLSLDTPETAIARVQNRVAQGGHNVPEETIRRRFANGLANFHGLYKPLVDAWILYDNSGDEPLPLDWSES
jgi:predicted ABC-type ATPase